MEYLHLSLSTNLATQGAANQQTHLPNLPPGGPWRGLDGRPVAVRMISWWAQDNLSWVTAVLLNSWESFDGRNTRCCFTLSQSVGFVWELSRHIQISHTVVGVILLPLLPWSANSTAYDATTTAGWPPDCSVPMQGFHRVKPPCLERGQTTPVGEAIERAIRSAPGMCIWGAYATGFGGVWTFPIDPWAPTSTGLKEVCQVCSKGVRKETVSCCVFVIYLCHTFLSFQKWWDPHTWPFENQTATITVG